MKLSEAIRLGARKRPQCAGILFLHASDPTNEAGVIKSCAMGAGLEGAGVVDPDKLSPSCLVPYREVEFDGLESYPDERFCPERCGKQGSIIELVEHLNDDEAWTREDIADWLEAIGC